MYAHKANSPKHHSPSVAPRRQWDSALPAHDARHRRRIRAAGAAAWSKG